MLVASLDNSKQINNPPLAQLTVQQLILCKLTSQNPNRHGPDKEKVMRIDLGNLAREEEVPDGNATGGCIAGTQSLRLLDTHIAHPLVERVGNLEFDLDVLYMTYEMPGFVLEPAFLRTACHVTLGPPYMLTHISRISGYSVWPLEYFLGRWLDLFHSTSFSSDKTHQLASLSKRITSPEASGGVQCS